MSTNVWDQMGYVPPRGQCNFKQTMISTRCPCLRFMLHPLKSSSSYECDGCSHHASFHSMENKHEDEVRKRWENEAKEKQEQEEFVADHPRKRTRLIEYRNKSSSSSNSRSLGSHALVQDELEALRVEAAIEAVESIEAIEAFKAGPSRTRPKPKRGGARSSGTRGAATRAKERVTEIIDDEDDGDGLYR
ncbi:hypothetical protein BU24DRAFT_416612 [Aaosphaeria arxii CBS 175.79]|uniref:Uncharacterized protein n=1 Tax=Aaosphaeria arxii CBS 175.79 TaxID=1450172 RepID=A0A6A5Y5X7_9PLEO|nr:uncharacterized protein BU24DRAFT_416612 [Aaosphaeria arxii CBS 175.79]KAF2020952.1 hypothetical protein BU24DRAFT_416612 [Aaosphaeria arxii CBS 175.79]